jgi:osmotically-inducible protein OsmY
MHAIALGSRAFALRNDGGSIERVGRRIPRRSSMKKTDSEIKQSVLQELKWDTRVSETEVGVEVDAGVVTLTGTVNSWAKKMAAEEASHRVIFVLDVANDINVKSPISAGRTDTDIAHAVRHALEWDVFVPDHSIRSTVAKGWVTLEGDVQFWSQRVAAENAVRNLAGVNGISNGIVVHPASVTPVEVKNAIEEALKRHSEREAKRIKLDVTDGRVSVSGSVHSWVERETVLGAARGTPGVRWVEEHLRIEP